MLTLGTFTGLFYFGCFGYLLLMLLQSFARYGWSIFLLEGSAQVEKNIKDEVVSTLFTIPISKLADKKSGEVIALATNDTDSATRVFDGGVIVSFDAVSNIVGIPIIMYLLSPKITLLVLIPIVIVPTLYMLTQKRLKKYFKSVQEAFSKIVVASQESISGARTIKGLAMEERCVKRFTLLGQQYLKSNLSISKLEAMLYQVSLSSIAISTLCLIWFGGNEVIQGTMTVGTFFALFRYVQSLSWPAQAIGIAYTILQKSLVSSKRIETLLQDGEKSTVAGEQMGIHDKNTIAQELLEVKNLSFEYPSRKITLASTDKDLQKNSNSTFKLSDVSFTLYHGERIAIVGAVNSGKTTLSKLLMGYYSIPEGKIFINGSDAASMPVSLRYKLIQYIPQDVHLFNTTIMNNLLVGAPFYADQEFNNASLHNKIYSAAATAKIHQEVEDFPDKYQTLLGEKGVQISGGQKQRLTITRALIEESQLIIFDDALSAVDIATERAILKNLEEVKGKRSELFITHRLSTAITADRIIVMSEGKIIDSGTHEELLARGSAWYMEFYNRQKAIEALEKLHE
jgi:ATP-binding cassette, subfamily B, multidrug efflux pump